MARPSRNGIVVPALLLAALLLALPAPAGAQRVLTQPEQIVTVSKGASALVLNQAALQRFSIGDPNVAEAVIVSPTQVLVIGKGLGTTSLLLWETAGAVRFLAVEVTADAVGLQRYLAQLMPEERIAVAASGNTITLSGQVRDASAAGRAVEVARGTGALVVDNLEAPAPVQVLLEVRFAEVNRSALDQMTTRLATANPDQLDNGGRLRLEGQSSSDGELRLSLLSIGGDSLNALFRVLKSKGHLRTLAEPNLLTLPGKEAYFLAGGEFPYPSIQGGTTNAITITFKEFGVRLRFLPTITRSGAIRLHLTPEVSALDFANALVISGFTIPALLTRRAETDIELQPGQHLAIAGLMDNSTVENITKIPILGDLPILGMLFRSKDIRQRRSELIVVVTPSLVQASNTPIRLPTGEAREWKWDRSLREFDRRDTTRAGPR